MAGWSMSASACRSDSKRATTSRVSMPALISLRSEVGPARRRGAGVEDLGDGWVVHERQRLPLGFEARHHFARIHARLDQLDSDAPANRLLLLGQPHLTHAALADQLEQTIGTDYRSGGRLTRSDRAGDELLFAVPRDCGAFVAWTVLIACSGLLNRHVGSSSLRHLFSLAQANTREPCPTGFRADHGHSERAPDSRQLFSRRCGNVRFCNEARSARFAGF